VTDEFPDPPALVPAVVRAAASGQAVRLAWRNELGGLTFEAGQGASRRGIAPDPERARYYRLLWDLSS
jgi:hypothetical protein